MKQELAIALRDKTGPTNRLAVSKLSEAYKAHQMTKWVKLPAGFTLWTLKTKLGGYYCVILIDQQVVGYVLIVKTLLQSKPKLKGWTVTQSYLQPEIRGVGIMRRVYDEIILKGRIFSAPTQTTQGMKMWLNRIKTDAQHVYLVYNSKKSFVRVTQQNLNQLKTQIWDGSPKTILITCLPKDPILKTLFR
jgi:hypothetical protein